MIAEDVEGPVWADAGDVIRVLEGVTVVGTGTQGIGPRTGSEIGFHVAVRGTVASDYVGVNLGSDPDIYAGNTLFISSTGRVTGVGTVYAGNGDGCRVVNAGLIDGTYGIYGDGDDMLIVNRGIIRSENWALNLTGDASVVRNHGLLETGGYFGETEGSRVFNTGTMDAESGGITVDHCTEFSLVNRGTINDQGNDDSAVELWGAQGFRIVNSGSFSAGYGLKIHDSDGFVRNTGTIFGESYGIDAYWVLERQIAVRNEGTITGNRAAILMDEAGLRLNNSGTIEGHVILAEGSYDDRILNAGHMTADVDLGGGDDRFFSVGSAEAAGWVRGGYGNDVITGGIGADRLSGDEGDDVLSGRRGADVLIGGSGQDLLRGGNGWDVLDGGEDDDVLDGGAGKDILTGGGGGDIFIFGPDAGDDRVTDFEQGSDLLRLTGHSGGFDALNVSVRNGHLEVVHDGGIIILEGLGAVTLTAGDFEFL